MPKFRIEYWEEESGFITIEAPTAAEAESLVRQGQVTDEERATKEVEHAEVRTGISEEVT